jgi:hypothetical protein
MVQKDQRGHPLGQSQQKTRISSGKYLSIPSGLPGCASSGVQFEGGFSRPLISEKRTIGVQSLTQSWCEFRHTLCPFVRFDSTCRESGDRRSEALPSAFEGLDAGWSKKSQGNYPTGLKRRFVVFAFKP